MKLARRTAGVICVALLPWFALPALADATLLEVGLKARTTAPTAPSCPGNPCLAVSRTTGFQASLGSLSAPVMIPKAGRIVAWTITLSKPSPSQLKFFDEHEGGAASAGLAILRLKHAQHAKGHSAAHATPRGGATSPPKSGSKAPSQANYTLVAQSPITPLEPYFGKTAQFALENTLEVKAGDVVALTVPTWAPALTLGFGKTATWRASRSSANKGCEETSVQTSLNRIGENNPFACLYHEARLTYSATLVSTP